MGDRPCRRPSGKHLVTFVVVADTHTNQSESESASNYESQILANARSRHVFAEIEALKPAFTIHLGILYTRFQSYRVIPLLQITLKKPPRVFLARYI